MCKNKTTHFLVSRLLRNSSRPWVHKYTRFIILCSHIYIEKKKKKILFHSNAFRLKFHSIVYGPLPDYNVCKKVLKQIIYNSIGRYFCVIFCDESKKKTNSVRLK